MQGLITKSRALLVLFVAERWLFRLSQRTSFVLVKISSIKARKIEADLLLVVAMLFVGYRTEQPEP